MDVASLPWGHVTVWQHVSDRSEIIILYSHISIDLPSMNLRIKKK